MNKIIVEVSVGELLDKISILEIKQEKIKNPEKLKFISDEHSVLKDQLDKNIKSDDKLKNLFQSLKEINSKLWVIEDDKRQCEKEKDFTESFIKLSRDVHFLNDDRAKIKLEINTARSNYEFAVEDFEIKKNALNLSKNISIKNEIKFFEGLTTSFDLSQAQRQLYMAQQDHLQSMLNILLKRVELESLINTPLKN